MSLAVAALCLTLVLASYVRGVSRYPVYMPSSVVEEWAYTYTTSQNYLRYGFANSALLPDTSNSPHRADHPYVYTHMPAGPDLVVALILKWTDNSYFHLRMVLAALFLAGIWCYYRFCSLLLDKYSLSGAGLALLFAGPWAWLTVMERSVYCLFPLLAFGPHVVLDGFYRDGRRWRLAVLLAMVFVSSIYIEYSLLVAVTVSWIALYLTQLIRIDRRHFILVIGTIVLGVLAHLVQNLLFLGPELFFRDIALSIGNRTIGHPSKEELAVFFQDSNILHHGSKPVRILGVLGQLLDNLSPLLSSPLLIACLALLLLCTIRVYRSGRVIVFGDNHAAATARTTGSALIWVVATISAPIFLFPAYSQEVSLSWSRANLYYIAVLQCLLTAMGLRQIYEASPAIRLKGQLLTIGLWRRSGGAARHSQWEMAAKYAIWLALLLVVVAAAVSGIRATTIELRAAVGTTLGVNHFTALEDLKGFSGHLYATNINSPVVGLFTNAPGFGVCTAEAVKDDGAVDTSTCHVAMMRQRAHYVAQRPKYFFLFGKETFTPGFATVEMLKGDGYETLQGRLEKNFTEVHSNKLFRVFDLSKR